MRSNRLSVRLIRAATGVFAACAVFSCFGTAAYASGKSGGPVLNAPRSKADSLKQVDAMSTSVVDRLWDRTDFWWHHGDYPRIVALDRTITEAEPHFLEPYSTGGWLMESDGDLKDAEAYYRLGVDRNPGKSYMYYQLGAFYYNTMHDYAKAAAVFAQSTTFPDCGDLDWKMYAHSLEHMNKLPEALVAWQTLKKKFPHSPAVDTNLARVQRLIAASNAQPTLPIGSVQQ